MFTYSARSMAIIAQPHKVPMRMIFRALHLIGSELTESPIYWAVAFFIPLVILFMFLGSFGAVPRLIRWERRLLQAAAGIVIAAFVGTAFLYLWSANFSDHVEPLVALNSWRFWLGDPVYHTLDIQQRYSTPYGPYLYILHALTAAALSPSIFASKLMGVLAASASLVLLGRTIAATTSRSVALIFTGLAAALCLAFHHSAFWNRPDPFLLFAVSLGLFAVRRGGAFAPFILGAALGLAVDMKTHAVFYFFPLIVLAWQHGWRRRAGLTVALTAIAIALIPFALFPNLSLRNYLLAVGIASGFSFAFYEFLSCAEWLATIVAPAALPALFSRLTNAEPADAIDRRSWVFLGAILLSCIPVLVPATLMASGAHHFMPFIPLLMLFAAEQARKGVRLPWPPNRTGAIAQSLRYSWLISCAIVALWSAYAMGERALHTQPRGLAYRRDVGHLLASYPNTTLLMGVGGDSDYWHTLVRHELVFGGMPPGIDPVAAMDFKGRDLPETNLDLLVDELSLHNPRPLFWLVPRGATPFTMRSLYAPNDLLFSENFRTDFSQHFEHTSSSEFFDVYEAKTTEAAVD